jgi:hypothetical protein
VPARSPIYTSLLDEAVTDFLAMVAMDRLQDSDRLSNGYPYLRSKIKAVHDRLPPAHQELFIQALVDAKREGFLKPIQTFFAKPPFNFRLSHQDLTELTFGPLLKCLSKL